MYRRARDDEGRRPARPWRDPREDNSLQPWTACASLAGVRRARRRAAVRAGRACTPSVGQSPAAAAANPAAGRGAEQPQATQVNSLPSGSAAFGAAVRAAPLGTASAPPRAANPGRETRQNSHAERFSSSRAARRRRGRREDAKPRAATAARPPHAAAPKLGRSHDPTRRGVSSQPTAGAPLRGASGRRERPPSSAGAAACAHRAKCRRRSPTLGGRAYAAAPTTPARAPRVARARNLARCALLHDAAAAFPVAVEGAIAVLGVASLTVTTRGAKRSRGSAHEGCEGCAGSRAHLGSNSRTATRPTDLSLSGCASAQETVRRSPPSLGVSPSATAVRAPSGDPPEGLLPACPGPVATPAAGADMAARRLQTRCPHGRASNARWSRARAALPKHTCQEGGCGWATGHVIVASSGILTETDLRSESRVTSCVSWAVGCPLATPRHS